jgi:hypothetical protein
MARAETRTTALEFSARNVIAACCAASAGVHAALVPEHLAEGAILGTGFVVAAVLLFATAVAFTGARPLGALVAPAAALLLVALICGYVASRRTGLTFIGAQVEDLDAVGLVTQAVQAAGLVAALVLTNPASTLVAVARRKDSHTCD